MLPHTNQAMFGLQGRRALVSGASRGLGLAMAEALAMAGADLVITGRDAATLETAAQTLRASGVAVEALVLDQRDAGAIEAALADIAPLDILVNNAGTEDVCASEIIPETLWDRILDTNLKGAFFLTQAVARPMLARGRGSIINLCSLTSFVGVPTAVPYGASKSGLLGMTRALSAEWAARGVRVNAIAPGYFRTSLTEVFYADAEWSEEMLGKIPMRRFGQGDDLAGVVIFLASDASAYVTGQCIGVDGGYLASI